MSFGELLDVVRALHGTLELAATLSTVVEQVARATGFEVAALNLRRDDHYEVVAIHGNDSVRRELSGARFPIVSMAGALAVGRRWGEVCFIHHDEQPALPEDMPIWSAGTTASTEDPEAWHPQNMLFVPLRDARGEHVGILSVDVPADGLMPTLQQVELLELFAHHAGIAIEHARLHDEVARQRAELHHSATTDHLTGLRNRSVFEREVPALMTQRGRDVVVLVLDLDGFKAVNDTGGHHVGDVVLSTLASRMRAAVRDADLLARTGGDEFVVVGLAEHGQEAVEEMIHRLEGAVREPVVVDGRTWQVGVSIGAATSPTPADVDAMLAAADAAMYDAKQARRGV